MTAFIVLVVAALMQGAFLVLLMVFLATRRQLTRRARARALATREMIGAPLSAWLGGSADVGGVIDALRAMPAAARIGFAVHLARTTVPDGHRDEFALALRREAWVRRAISRSRSRLWVRRLDAARCISVAGSPADGADLERLLNDRVPGVAVAAVDALPRVADARLVGAVLDRIVDLPAIVRLYLQSALRDVRAIVEPQLCERLRSDAPSRSLARWSELAGALDLPNALVCVAELAANASPQVRAAVARALRRSPRDRSVAVLRELLRDPEPTVRASAVHALGELSPPQILKDVLDAVHDNDWNVRYRASLALTQLGEPGRAALRTLRADADRYVADMATLISGFSDGALREAVEV